MSFQISTTEEFAHSSYLPKGLDRIVLTFALAVLRRLFGPPRGAPFLRIFGNPSSQINLVMTSAYERTSGIWNPESTKQRKQALQIRKNYLA